MALCAGVAVGATWAAVYGDAVPTAWLLLLHVGAALCLYAALRLLGRRLATALPVGLAVVLTFLVAPAALSPPYRAGVWWGLTGVAIDAGVLAAATALAVLIGLGLTAGGARRAAAILLLAGCAAAPIVVIHRFSAERNDPVTWGIKISDRFPGQPVAVVGIDGGDWQVAEPLMKAGLMPNLARLVSEGQHGVLRSLTSTMSPVVWTSIFTGQPPGVHGIWDWYAADTRNLRLAPLWDLFAANGCPTLTVNVPGSWPPQPLPGGAVVSGVPVPGMDVAVSGLPFGHVVSSRSGRGMVPTLAARPLGDGRFSFELPVGLPSSDHRLPSLRSSLVDKLGNRLGRFSHQLHIPLEATVTPTGVTVRGGPLAEDVTAPLSGAPRWMVLSAADRQAVALVAVLDASPDAIELYLSEPAPAPWTERFRGSAGVPADLLADRHAPYVVEGPAWLIWRDGRVPAVLADAALMVEARRVALVEAMIARLRPQLLAFVVTVTDRLQHAFLPVHANPGKKPRRPRPSRLGDRDPVTEAYRLADRALGMVVESMPRDTLVIVVSDHGCALRPSHGDGEHRPEGIWAARGPMVPHLNQPTELSVLDVVPTLMECIGAPLASDLAGTAYHGLCPAVAAPGLVATYSAERPISALEHRLDRSREQQVKSLGYIQ